MAELFANNFQTQAGLVTRVGVSSGSIAFDDSFQIASSSYAPVTLVSNTRLGSVLTNVSYIPYMRGMPIEFVSYGLRPYRQVYIYFDDTPMNMFVQSPNIIETTSRDPNLKDIKNGNREHIRIGDSTAKILSIETNENDGNTRIYVTEFSKPNKITVGDFIRSANSSYISYIKAYQHCSGIAEPSSNIGNIVLSADADMTTVDYYTGNVITIVTGSSAGESAEIINYDPQSRTANVSPAFSNVDAGAIYTIGDKRSSWAANNTQNFYVSPRGILSGILHIPDPAKSDLKFTTGDRILRILDNSRNDLFQYTCRADYRFVSNGLNLSKAQIIERNFDTTVEKRFLFIIDPTPTPTRTPTNTPTQTMTPTPSKTGTPTKTPTPSQTSTPTNTPTATGTLTPSPSQTRTPTVTPTLTPTNTTTQTPTQTPTTTPTTTPSSTLTQTPTLTPTNTTSNTPTSSRTPTPSVTPTSTATVTPTRTRTPTPSNIIKNQCTPKEAADAPTRICSGHNPQTKKDLRFWNSASVYRYTDAGGNIIQGPPNWKFLEKDILGFGGIFGQTYPQGGGWTVATVNGFDVYNMPAGVRFPAGSYLQVYFDSGGAGRQRGPNPSWSTRTFDVSGLYAASMFCPASPGQGGPMEITTGCWGFTRLDPTAQTFYLDKVSHPDGTFVTSIDLFFKNKGTLPVELQLRPVEQGKPSSNTVIPGAVVVKEPEDVVLSLNPVDSIATTNTRFTFSSPVYLGPGYEYAIVVITDDYDYDMYLSEVGGIILGTEDRKISKQPFLGSVFKSQNAKTWTPIQDEDMMFIMNRCSFNVPKGTVIMNEDKAKLPGSISSNTAVDYFEMQSDAIEFNNTKLVYYGKLKSNATGELDQTYLQFTPENRIDLIERKVVQTANSESESVKIKVDMSTNNPEVSPVIFQNRQNFVAIENIINNTGLKERNFVITNAGTGYTGNAAVEISSTVGYGANAYAVVSEGEITRIIVDNEGIGYVDDATATIVGDGTGAALVVSTETGTSGGPALARYISKTITLRDNFDAGDLRVFLTAVKPAGSNVQVYYKIRNSLDPDPIEQKNWIRMVQKTSEYIYSTDGEQIEYEYRPSLTSNNITYSTDLATYKTFNQFVIKIVLSSDGTVASKIPLVYDLRAIALPEDVY